MKWLFKKLYFKYKIGNVTDICQSINAQTRLYDFRTSNHYSVRYTIIEISPKMENERKDLLHTYYYLDNTRLSCCELTTTY